MSSTPLQLPNTHTAPPGGWRYRAPHTGQPFVGASLPDLLHQVRAHYKATGYKQPENLEQLVEENLCAAMPDYCTGNAQPVRPTLAHTLHTVLQGTKTLGSWLLGGRHYVEQAVANQRAQVCSSCPMNEEPEGCTSCNRKSLTEAVEKIVGKRSTPYDGQLQACRVCACHLRSKVHLPHAVLWRHMPAEQKERLPAHCWLLTELIKGAA